MDGLTSDGLTSYGTFSYARDTNSCEQYNKSCERVTIVCAQDKNKFVCHLIKIACPYRAAVLCISDERTHLKSSYQSSINQYILLYDINKYSRFINWQAIDHLEI